MANKSASKAKYRLTELESCTLGAIRQHQPCSTYEVRRMFARSPTADWSASAGSIYPVIERLQEMKLVVAEPRAGDARGRRDLTVTRKGEEAIRRWIVDLAPWTAKAATDPIRTRTHFLDFIPKGDRAAFIARAEELTHQALAEQRAYIEEWRRDGTIDQLANQGAVLQLEMRLKWLGLVRKAVMRERG